MFPPVKVHAVLSSQTVKCCTYVKYRYELQTPDLRLFPVFAVRFPASDLYFSFFDPENESTCFRPILLQSETWIEKAGFRDRVYFTDRIVNRYPSYRPS